MTYRRGTHGMWFRRWGSVGVIVMIAAALLSPGSSKAADNAPSTSANIRQWVTHLSSRVPSQREAAYRHLVGLPRDGLMILRDAIKDRSLSMAGQEDVLHEIVNQVFLSTESYEYDPLRGFMGVIFDVDQQDEVSPYEGVEIRHVIPGLCASKYLEEGDIILSMQIEKEIHPLRHALEMKGIVASLPAGQNVMLAVLRRGRMTSVEIVLGGTPVELNPTDPQAIRFQAERQTEADASWDEHFEPLFSPAPTTRVSTSNP
jgi:hypothetical protein